MSGLPTSADFQNTHPNDTNDVCYSVTSTRHASLDLSQAEKSMDSAKPSSALQSVISRQGSVSASYSGLRRYSLLVLFCLAQFLDIFNLFALISGIPTIAAHFDMAGSESVWSVSALQLTFASFLLVVSNFKFPKRPRIH